MRSRFIILLFLSLTVLLFSCAKIVTPVGGPKDVTPPTVVKESPVNGTSHFKSNVIKITFNEYVTLNNTTENILISPPLATPPTYTLSGKTLSIKFHDTLQSGQTYNIGFAGCICDYTEGNAIPFYNYAFSTGASVDSFMLKGSVVNALSNTPLKDCFVFAYTEDTDSLPLTVKPQYMGKTQDNGTFLIKNIKPGNYKIFALKDINNNLIYDLPDEEVAFCNSLQPAHPIPSDSAETDTFPTIKLFSFVIKDTTQAFVKMQNKEHGKYEFIFKNNIQQYRIDALSGTLPDYWSQLGGDTLTLYLKEKIADTVVIALHVDERTCDTLRLTPYKKIGGRNRARRDDSDKASLSVKISRAGELYTPIRLNFSYPIRPTEPVEAILVGKRRHSGNDTLHYTIPIPDSLVTHLDFQPKLEEKVPYTLTIRDSAFMGYNDAYNDSIVFNFTNKTAKDYGSLRINYDLPDHHAQYIIYLLNSQGNIIRTDYTEESKEIFYPNLIAGNYKIKVIEDLNRNGVWDTGDYRTKTQPEKIVMFPKGLTVRGYWELEEIFEWPESK